jgi:hypothetical protein
MHAMWLGKMKLWAFGLLSVTVISSGTASFALMPAEAQEDKLPLIAAQQPDKAQAKQADAPARQPSDYDIRPLLKSSPLAEPTDTDDELRRLLKERYKTVLREFTLRHERFLQGVRQETIEVLLNTLQRLAESEIELSSRKDDHIAALERVVAIANIQEEIARLRYQNGLITEQDSLQVRYVAQNWRIKLLELKGRAK